MSSREREMVRANPNLRFVRDEETREEGFLFPPLF